MSANIYDSTAKRLIPFAGNSEATAGSLDGLSDVSISSPTDGQVLTYDATNDVWINDEGAAVIESLGDIADVDLTNLEDGQTIVWDATEEKWVPGNGGGSSLTAGFGIDIDNGVIKTTDFVGTQAQWNALTSAQKAAYDFVNITDDSSEVTYSPGHAISDGTTEKTQREVLEFDGFTVTDDSVNGKTKISEVPYTAGSLIDITNKEISVDENKVKSTFVGTIAEWEALSSSEKAEYELVNLTDDLAGGAQAVVDAVEENNFSPVTSNAVYGNLAGFRFRNNNGVPELSMDGGATWNSLIGGSGGMKSKVAFGGLMNETTLTITLSSVGISVNSADDYFLIITPRQGDLTISGITKTQTQFTITRGTASTTPSLVVQVVYNPS